MKLVGHGCKEMILSWYHVKFSNTMRARTFNSKYIFIKSRSIFQKDNISHSIDTIYFMTLQWRHTSIDQVPHTHASKNWHNQHGCQILIQHSSPCATLIITPIPSLAAVHNVLICCSKPTSHVCNWVIGAPEVILSSIGRSGECRIKKFNQMYVPEWLISFAQIIFFSRLGVPRMLMTVLIHV